MKNLLNTISLIYFSLVVCFQGSYLLNKLGALLFKYKEVVKIINKNYGRYDD